MLIYALLKHDGTMPYSECMHRLPVKKSVTAQRRILLHAKQCIQFRLALLWQTLFAHSVLNVSLFLFNASYSQICAHLHTRIRNYGKIAWLAQVLVNECNLCTHDNYIH